MATETQAPQQAEQERRSRTSGNEREDARVREGIRKAAILLIALDEEVAAEVLGELTEDEAKLLSKEILNLGLVDRTRLASVVREFNRMVNLSDCIQAGGAEHAFKLLKKSFPPDVSKQIIRTLSSEQMEKPFDFLRGLEADTLLPFLQKEHPQTIAVILSHLEPSQAAEIIGKLPPDSRSDIVYRIATLEHTSPEAVEQVEQGLKKYVSTLAFEELEEFGGVKPCAEILNVLDRTVQGEILDVLEDTDTELVDEIKKRMFVFDDLLKVDDKGIQGVLKEVENRTLAMALKGASDQLRDKVLSNMSQRAAESIREEISFLGPVRVIDVQAAQQVIVDIVRRLEEAGEVIIAGRGGEGAMIE